MGNSQKRKIWKGTELRDGDVVMTDPRDTDLVIPIMGPTGSGKSSFINVALGQVRALVKHDLKSQTAKVQHYVLVDPKDDQRRIILVDTPGFDDTFREDAEILRRIAVWLAKSYSDNMKLAGVIYLHDVTLRRMFGAIRKNFDMFKKLCGVDALPNIILTTTMWDEVSLDVGQRREQDLRETYWKDMLEHGSTMHRFRGTSSSAWDIINFILKQREDRAKHAIDGLQIQEELVQLQLILPQTEVAQELRYMLKELLEVQKATAKQLQEQRGIAPDEQLHERVEENNEKIRSVLLQLRALKVPLSKRIAAFVL